MSHSAQSLLSLLVFYELINVHFYLSNILNVENVIVVEVK